MDKSKHTTTTYVRGDSAVAAAINNPRFRNLTCLDKNQFYEVETSKASIKYDLPFQLGFFILQYAKQRMLEFYYDFVDKFVDRRNFEYCEMDTDSTYMSISGPTLSLVVKPGMRTAYFNLLNQNCLDELTGETKLWLPRSCCDKHTCKVRQTYTGPL